MAVSPLPPLNSTDWYGWATDVDAQARSVDTGAVTGIGRAPNVQTAAYTLVAGDAQGLVSVNSSSALTVTVPPNSSAAFPQGAVVWVAQAGTGQVTIAAGTGVTLRPPTGRDVTTRAQYSVLRLRQAAVNTWYLDGDLTRTDTDPTAKAYTDTAVNYAPIVQVYASGAWPIRQNTSGTNRPVLWVGPGPGPASGGTTVGGTRAYAPGDLFMLS